jgi:hypothetical protein
MQTRKQKQKQRQRQKGGGCDCGILRGGALKGYKATKKNRDVLRRWRRGESIGFTATSSLKAKGLLPRTSKKNRGKYIVSKKYQ